MAHMKDYDLVSRVVDRVENQKRIAHHGQHPHGCFVGEVSDKRKFREQGRKALDTLYHSSGGGSVVLGNI